MQKAGKSRIMKVGKGPPRPGPNPGIGMDGTPNCEVQQKTMAARLLTPVLKAAAPRVAAHTRAMATKVEDVKLKDLPAYAQQVVNDPKTRTAYEVSNPPPAPPHAPRSGRGQESARA